MLRAQSTRVALSAPNLICRIFAWKRCKQFRGCEEVADEVMDAVNRMGLLLYEQFKTILVRANE
jgi:hypothetical protein